MYYLSFLPLIDPVWLWLLAGIMICLVLLTFTGNRKKALLRFCLFSSVLLALWNPNLSEEERTPIESIALVLVDRTTSQTIGDRKDVTDSVKESLQRQLEELKATQTRFIDIPDGSNNSGTRIISALSTALADIPRQRLAGIVIITDGVAHDIQENLSSLALSVPVHILITGYPDEKDRQIRFTSTPRFAIVGKKQNISAIVEERNGTGRANVRISLDGKVIEQRQVITGRNFSFDLDISHAGMNIVEMNVEPLDQELTLANNHAVLSIDGVRDKLRVLLVSGEPHVGGRTWRNLLKSDANIDLVHFTILRDINKSERAPENELALIVFPITELFINKIQQFDLIILDRFDNYGILPFEYFQNIARYVEEGGALLIAAGPEFADEGSLALTPLRPVIPAFPDGRIIEQPFKPLLTDQGKHHPVTRGLTGSAAIPPVWGEWLRQIGASETQGNILLSGYDNAPLLILEHVKKGRTALILSDHPWLWARGYRGGGPHADLLRHIAHWLMKEPALEEEALRAAYRNGTITIERQTMHDTVEPVTIRTPDGNERTTVPVFKETGLFTAEIPAEQNGMHMISSGDLSTFVSIGPSQLRELEDIFSNLSILNPLATSSGGTIRRVGQTSGKSLIIPKIRQIKPHVRAYGDDWIGLREPSDSIIKGVRIFPLGIGFAALFLLAGLALFVWIAESRQKEN